MADGDLSPQDLDLMARTLVGEAGNQPPIGQAAVAHVILNRAANGGYGGTSPAQVVLAPNQFEPWSTRAQELSAIPRDSPEYQNAVAIVKGAASGKIPDPTDGSTYFMNEDTVRQRNGGTIPQKWAQGPGLRIGEHTFFKPQDGGKAASAQPQQNGQAQAMDSEPTDKDVQDTMNVFGLSNDGKAQPSNGQATAPPVQDKDVQETMKMFGIAPNDGKTSNAPAPSARPSDLPKEGYYDNRLHVNLNRPAGMTDQVVEGMPVIGPLFNKALAATEAALDPIFPNASSKPPTFGERYTKNLADIVGGNKQYADENPIKSTLANLVGGGMVLGPVAGTLPGRIAMGIEGPTLGSRIVQGATSGGALGALDALLRNESPSTGAIVGAAGGAAGPAIAGTVRGATNVVLNNLIPKQGALKDVGNIAINKILGGMEGETPASIAAGREKMGPAGFLADAAPGLTDVAGGVADTSGSLGKSIVRGAYQTRAAQQGQRIESALTDAAGPQANIETFKNFWTEARKDAADPLYEQWRNSSVFPTDKLKSLIPRLESSGAFDMAEKLSGISGEPINKSFFTTGAQKQYPTAQSWDYVKRGLDSKIDQAYTGGDKTLARSLVTLKNEMLSEIEKTPAGQIWKQARTEFADRSSILDQIEAGRDTFLGGRSGLSVDELREELKALKGPELAARIVGMRSAAGQAMGDTVRGDTTLRNKMLAPNNVEKMKLLLGDAKAEKLIKSMQQEKYLGDQYQNVVGGSQTAPKAERINALKAPDRPEWGFDVTKPGTYLPPTLRSQLNPMNILDAWRHQAYGNANEQMGRLLTTKEGPKLQDLLDAFQAEQARRAAISGRSSLATNALSSLVSLPGTTTARRQLIPAK